MIKQEKSYMQFYYNAVTKKELREIVDYEQPTKYIVGSTRYDEIHGTPVLTAGQSFILGYTDETAGIYKASKENPVIIFDDFTTSFHWVDFDFKVKSSALKILTPKEKSSSSFRYIYYAMKSISYKPVDHARQWISVFSKIKIDIPSLKVQEDIAKYLDKFNLLITELNTELMLRRKQYLYYRNKILDFTHENAECLEINEIFDIRNGYTPSKAKAEYWTKGIIPWFRLDDIRQNGRILFDSLQHITPEAVKGKGLFPKNSIIVSTSATIGEHALIKVDFLCNQRFTCLTIKPEFTHKLNIIFLHHYMYLVDEWCKNNINISGFAGVDMPKFKRVKIPIPSMLVQERVINVLDKFESLVNDNNIGIPAEIDARRRQYDYYRRKLLKFEQLVN